ncbi:hypothetical protein B9T24_03295 [Acinetobacter sp. ANC 4654]|uniref:hypothetical protein n=1 Tax=Acinetobacter sp. ANC 4654 TaxID=1977872 RepID=UPI000A359B81|nr:hypothetical protein [Acinetobacter sp. ANC 4654]OTG98374.1 hypothetical protein B9T24_03295 [Acinetobacter sp. ANC 4654]
MGKPILRVLYAYYPNNFIFQINSTMTFYPDKKYNCSIHSSNAQAKTITGKALLEVSNARD